MEKLAILDCGGQYTKVIDRKVRELLVESHIFPIDVSAEKLRDYNGIILSGGPESVWEKNSIKTDKNIFSLGIPILGICYGMHLINVFYNGIVSPNVKKEYGEAVIDIKNNCPLFEGLSEKQSVLMSHGDSVEKVAEGFEVCAVSGDVIAGIYNKELNIYAVQFHPEVDLSVNGKQVIDNFLRKICCCKDKYSLEDRINTSISQIKHKVGDNKVIVLVSGGVDSAVTAALLVKALKPEQIYAVHIDHGLMRKNESDLICEDLKKQGLKNLIRVNAKEDFYNIILDDNGKKLGPLTSLIDPEEKRNLIGQVFIKVTEKATKDLDLDFQNTFLAQGTLRPDLIESGNPLVSSYAKKIKTHHNDVDIIRKAREKGLIVETNWDWHKDEVRQVARLLGLSEKIANRQPFPGPGLGVRIICSDGIEAIPKEDCTKLEDLISNYKEVCDARIAPVKTVGVQGDYRTHGYLTLLWDNGNKFEWDNFYNISKEITNNIHSVNRVAYVLNENVPSGKIKLNPAYISDESVKILQEIDNMVTTALENKPISQTFAVLVPIGITKKYSVAIRTFVTNDFMTGRPASIGTDIEYELVSQIAKDIKNKFDEIEFVLYDITSKPPATCEWQ